MTNETAYFQSPDPFFLTLRSPAAPTDVGISVFSLYELGDPFLEQSELQLVEKK